MISPLRQQAESRNLGQFFLANFVVLNPPCPSGQAHSRGARRGDLRPLVLRVVQRGGQEDQRGRGRRADQHQAARLHPGAHRRRRNDHPLELSQCDDHEKSEI